MINEHSRKAADAVCFAAEYIRNRMVEYISGMDCPSMILRPRLSRDGNQWCALYGDDLMQGVVGFGASPALAYGDFDRAWFEKIATIEKEK